MKQYKFLDYVKMRISKRRKSSIMGDLLGDMQDDMRNLEEAATFSAINSRVTRRGCDGCIRAFSTLKSQYRKYSREHNLTPETL